MTKSFPSFLELAKASWDLFLNKLKPLFFLGLLATLVSAFLATLVSLLAFGGVAGKFIGAMIGDEITTQTVFRVLLESLPQLGLMLAVLLIILIVVSCFYATAQTLIMAEYSGMKDIIARAKNKLTSVLLGSLVVSFLVFGAFWLLFIPSLILAFFFSFLIYEQVLTDKGVISALRRSVAIIWHNFWPLLGRMVLMLLLVGLIRGIFSSNQDKETYSIISWLINTTTGWYMICYSYLLYKSSSARTPKNASANLTWVVVPAAIGWLIFAAGLTSGINFAKESGFFNDFSGKLEQMIKENQEISLPENLSDFDLGKQGT